MNKKHVDYSLKIAEEKVESLDEGLESREAQVQRYQAKIVARLQAKLEAMKNGYEVLIEELGKREEQNTLKLPEEQEEDPELQLPSKSANYGLEGFFEPGKIVFRP